MICKGYVVSAPVDFGIARSRIRYSHHIFVHLHSDGVDGWGEGVLYRATPHQVARLFAGRVKPWIEDLSIAALTKSVMRLLSELAVFSPSLACAVDTALLDLQSQAERRSVTELLGGAHRDAVPVTEQLFVQDWARAEHQLESILGRGTRRLKVKIGSNPEADLRAVRCIREKVGDAVEIRVDANRAYTLDEGRELYRRLADVGVLGLEEPLRFRHWSELRNLREEVRLPIILDESIQQPQALGEAIDARAIDVLNLKLSRLGGIRLARTYQALCLEHHVQVAVGCSEELGVGTAAIVHTAATLPQLHSVEGLGPLRLGFDVLSEAWTVHDGALWLPAGAGLGVAPRAKWPEFLPKHVRCYDLSHSSQKVWPFSAYSRLVQRANNVFWRARRRMVH